MLTQMNLDKQCFGLSCDDAQDRDWWRLRIKEVTG